MIICIAFFLTFGTTFSLEHINGLQKCTGQARRSVQLHLYRRMLIDENTISALQIFGLQPAFMESHKARNRYISSLL